MSYEEGKDFILPPCVTQPDLLKSRGRENKEKRMKKSIDINKVMTDYERNVLGIGASPEEKVKADAMTPLKILDAREKETESYLGITKLLK